MKPRLSLGDRLWKMFVWGAMAFFLFNVLLLIATVAVNSVRRAGSARCLPAGFTPALVRAGMERLPACERVVGDSPRWLARWVLLSIALGVAGRLCACPRAISRQALRHARVPASR